MFGLAARNRCWFSPPCGSWQVEQTGPSIVAFAPQMLAWKAIYGHYLAVSPVGPQIRWTDPHLGDILWSARNGLFSTAPILYLGALGLIGFATYPLMPPRARPRDATSIRFRSTACVSSRRGFTRS